MKKILYITIGLMTFSTINVSAQNWKDIRKKAKTAAKTNASGINPKGALSQDEVGKGLKEALNQGVKKGVTQLNKKIFLKELTNKEGIIIEIKSL